MSFTKKDIRELIAQGQLREAAAAAVAYAGACGLAEASNTLIVLQGNLEEHRRQWNTGQIAYEEFARQHARATQGLTDCLEDLPEVAAPGAGKKRLTDENTFKQRLFWMLVIAKGLVFGWTYYLWQTGGFQIDEAMTAFSALSPAFVAYISLMLADYLRAHHEDQPLHRRRYVSVTLTRVSYWLFPLYTLAQMYIVGQKAQGALSFAQMNVMLALVESVLGGYVGQIVQAFFKKNNS